MAIVGALLLLSMPLGLLAAITALALEKPLVNRICSCGQSECSTCGHFTVKGN